MSHTRGVFLDQIPGSKLALALKSRGVRIHGRPPATQTQSSPYSIGPSSRPLPDAGSSGMLLRGLVPSSEKLQGITMETLQAASHKKGAVSSFAHLGLRAKLTRRWQKCFIFSLLRVLSEKRGNLYRQTNPTLAWKEAAGPALPWWMASS